MGKYIKLFEEFEMSTDEISDIHKRNKKILEDKAPEISIYYKSFTGENVFNIKPSIYIIGPDHKLGTTKSTGISYRFHNDRRNELLMISVGNIGTEPHLSIWKLANYVLDDGGIAKIDAMLRGASEYIDGFYNENISTYLEILKSEDSVNENYKI